MAVNVQRLAVMSDICMCHNSGDCPLSATCFRALATPGEYQTVADFYKPDEGCEHYWPCESFQDLAKLNREWRD